MINALLLSQRTKLLIDNYLARPTQTLIIEGKEGLGKKYTANYLAEQLLNENKTENSNYILIKPVKNTISIEQIREARNNLKLKIPSKDAINRVVTINDADTMTEQAQNAALKTLEEPPKGTVFILTSSHKNKLLPTIISRSQMLNILPPSKEETIKYFSGKGYSDADINQAYLVSSGRIGLMTRILEHQEDSVSSSIDQAKKFLSSTTEQKLKQINSFKDLEAALNLVDSVIMISRAGITNAGHQSSEKWLKIYSQSMDAKQKLSANVSPKISLTELTINI